MDALVFFAVAMLISSILMSRAYAGSMDAVGHLDPLGVDDATEVLPVLLRASLGEDVVIDTSDLVIIRRTATIGECLSAEVAALRSGESLAAFEVLNAVVLSAAERLVSPLVLPHIWLMYGTDGSLVCLAAIERQQPSAENREAASFDLPAEYGSRCAVTLVLEPSALGP